MPVASLEHVYPVSLPSNVLTSDCVHQGQRASASEKVAWVEVSHDGETTPLLVRWLSTRKSDLRVVGHVASRLTDKLKRSLVPMTLRPRVFEPFTLTLRGTLELSGLNVRWSDSIGGFGWNTGCYGGP